MEDQLFALNIWQDLRILSSKLIFLFSMNKILDVSIGAMLRAKLIQFFHGARNLELHSQKSGSTIFSGPMVPCSIQVKG